MTTFFRTLCASVALVALIIPSHAFAIAAADGVERGPYRPIIRHTQQRVFKRASNRAGNTIRRNVQGARDFAEDRGEGQRLKFGKRSMRGKIGDRVRGNVQEKAGDLLSNECGEKIGTDKVRCRRKAKSKLRAAAGGRGRIKGLARKKSREHCSDAEDRGECMGTLRSAAHKKLKTKRKGVIRKRISDHCSDAENKAKCRSGARKFLQHRMKHGSNDALRAKVQEHCGDTKGRERFACVRDLRKSLAEE